MYKYILDWRGGSYGTRIWGTISGYISSKFFELIEGRAPIDPNLVLAIEQNQQNQINITRDRELVMNGTIRTIVDEYTQLALYDVFQAIVVKLIGEDDKMQE